jgi:hypothetical protein
MEKKFFLSEITGNDDSTITVDHTFVRKFALRVKQKFKLQQKFYHKYPIVKELIDKEADTRFVRLVDLSPNKKELRTNKEIISTLIYFYVYKRLEYTIPYRKIPILLDQTDEILKEVGLLGIASIVKEYLEIIDLLLSAFEKSNYKLKKNIQDLRKSYGPIKKRAKVMTAKKLTKEKKDEYMRVLKKQREMNDKYGISSQKSSLTNAVRLIFPNLPINKIKSFAETIRYHQKLGNLPK